MGLLIAVMLFTYLISKTVNDAKTDRALADKGIVSPRLQAKYGDEARAKTQRYGLADFVADAWSDNWRQRTELRRDAHVAARAAEPAEPGRKVRWRDRLRAADTAIRKTARKVAASPTVRKLVDPVAPAAGGTESPTRRVVAVDTQAPELWTKRLGDGGDWEQWNGTGWVPVAEPPRQPVPADRARRMASEISGGRELSTPPAARLADVAGRPADAKFPCAGCGRPMDEHIVTPVPGDEPELRCPTSIDTRQAGDGSQRQVERQPNAKPESTPGPWATPPRQPLDSVGRAILQEEREWLRQARPDPEDAEPPQPTAEERADGPFNDEQTMLIADARCCVPVAVRNGRLRYCGNPVADGLVFCPEHLAQWETVHGVKVTVEETKPSSMNGEPPMSAPTGEAVNYETTVAELEAIAEEQRKQIEQAQACLDAVAAAKAAIDGMQESYRATASAAANVNDHLTGLHLDGETLGHVGNSSDAMPPSAVDNIFTQLEEIEAAAQAQRDNAEVALGSTEAALATVHAKYADAHSTVQGELGGDSRFLDSGGTAAAAPPQPVAAGV